MFYFSNQRLNNHSIFNLLYFLCYQTFNAALVNAFYGCIHNVCRHFKVEFIVNLSFQRVFSHFFSPIWTAKLFYRCVKLVKWVIQVFFCFHFSVPICQSCCTMTHFRPNPVTGFRGIYTCDGWSVDQCLCCWSRFVKLTCIVV